MEDAGLKHTISKLPMTARFRPSLAALRKVHKKGVIDHQQSSTLRHSDLVQAGLGSLDAADRCVPQPGHAQSCPTLHVLRTALGCCPCSSLLQGGWSSGMPQMGVSSPPWPSLGVHSLCRAACSLQECPAWAASTMGVCAPMLHFHSAPASSSRFHVAATYASRPRQS